jgi:hypothetical protein
MLEIMANIENDSGMPQRFQLVADYLYQREDLATVGPYGQYRDMWDPLKRSRMLVAPKHGVSDFNGLGAFQQFLAEDLGSIQNLAPDEITLVSIREFMIHLGSLEYVEPGSKFMPEWSRLRVDVYPNPEILKLTLAAQRIDRFEGRRLIDLNSIVRDSNFELTSLVTGLAVISAESLVNQRHLDSLLASLADYYMYKMGIHKRNLTREELRTLRQLLDN